jgi:hypothetical protein
MKITRGLSSPFLGLSLLAAVLTGCPKPPPASQFPTGTAALDRMKSTYACANGVQGEAKIDYFGDKGRVRSNVTVFAVNAARVRLDVLSPLMAVLYTLTSNGTDFEMLDMQKQIFMYGPATPCNLARMTQVEVPGHVLVWLLRGEAPLLKHDRNAPTIVWEDGHYHVTIPSTRNATQHVNLEVYDADYNLPWQKQRVRVVNVETIQKGVVLYQAELEDHELARTLPTRKDPDGLGPDIPPSGGACNVEIPRSIQLSVPWSGDEVVFQYQKVGFNPPIPTGAFSQQQPAGTRKQFVNCR